MEIICAGSLTVLELGKRGSNQTRAIRFDIAEWMADYPDGSVHILHKRPGEETPLPVSNTEKTDTYIDWVIEQADVANEGYGECELVMMDTISHTAKSVTYMTHIGTPISSSDETVPEPHQGWVDSVLQAATDAEAAKNAAVDAQTAAETAQSAAEAAQTAAEKAQDTAENAKASAVMSSNAAYNYAADANRAKRDSVNAKNDAVQAKTDAENAQEAAENAEESANTSALKSEGYAVGTQNGTPAGSGEPYYQDNAKYYKEQAAAAKTAAETARDTAQQTVAGIEAAGTAQVERVAAEGATQVTNVQTKGQQVLDSIPSDYSQLSGNVDELKSALQAYEGGTTGQVLRKKSNADNDVEWASVGQPTDEQTAQAVSDWLDEHPEATTTVQDGSLTEEKIEPETLLALKNDYVTPEMFGAKGDGINDDTQAIKDMFASGAKKIVFLHELYKVTGGINVTIPGSIIDFGTKTEFTLQRNYDVRDFDYVIGFMAIGIITKGKLYVNANSSVNVGIWLSQCAGSSFEYINCNYARVWGICTDTSNASLGSMRFGYLGATACGRKEKAKGICNENGTMTITGMFSNTDLTDDAIRSILDQKYYSSTYIVDDSNWQDEYGGNEAGSRFAWATNTKIVLDEEDITKGTFTVDYGVALTTSYQNNGDPRDIFIPIGGGIKLQPSTSEGVFDIDKIDTMRCPIGISLLMQYGGTIRNLMSQYDTIVMNANCIAAVIEYMYLEAVGTGFNVTDKYNRIYLISANSNPKIEVINPFVGSNRIAFFQENEVLCSQEAQTGYSTSTSLLCSSYLVRNKLNGINTSGSSAWATTIDEYSPRDYTINATGFNGENVLLDLKDLNSQRKNRFTPVTIYIKKTGNVDLYEPLGIKLSQKLTTAGYNINDSVNGVYVINSGNYDRMMKVKIILFYKTFYIIPERIYPNYAQKTEIEVSIIKPTGDIHTLLSYPITYNFGEKTALSINVTSDSQYRFMFSCPAQSVTALTINGIVGTSGDTIAAGKTYLVDVWAGIAMIKDIVVDTVDTTARIAQNDYALDRDTTATKSETGWSYTEWYYFNPSIFGQTIFVDNCTDPQHTVQYEFDDGSKGWYYGPRNNFGTNEKKPTKIRFSIETSKIVDSYAYNETTGQIFFAGGNTQYYGYTNINDMPT